MQQVAVGGTTVTLFTKHGTLRQGPADLRIWAGVSAAETAANVPLNNNQARVESIKLEIFPKLETKSEI